MVHPVLGTVLQAAIMGFQGPPTKFVEVTKNLSVETRKARLYPKGKCTEKKKEKRVLEETALPGSQIGIPTSRHHFRSLPRSVYPVAPMEL